MRDEALKRAVIHGCLAGIEELTRKALFDGRTPEEVLDCSLNPAMDIVRQKFISGQVFFPELLVSARAFEAGKSLLKLDRPRDAPDPRPVLAVGEGPGDLHDIGTDCLVLLLQQGGFEVVREHSIEPCLRPHRSMLTSD